MIRTKRSIEIHWPYTTGIKQLMVHRYMSLAGNSNCFQILHNWLVWCCWWQQLNRICSSKASSSRTYMPWLKNTWYKHGKLGLRIRVRGGFEQQDWMNFESQLVEDMITKRPERSPVDCWIHKCTIVHPYTWCPMPDWRDALFSAA